MGRKLSTIVAVAALAALGACGDGGSGRQEASPTPSQSAIRSTAKLRVVEPKQAAVVEADAVPVRLELEGARILERASKDVRPDTGHVHVLLQRPDGTTETVSLLAGLQFDLVEMLRKGKKAPLSKGRHLLTAEFATANHGFFFPRVLTTVTFTVA